VLLAGVDVDLGRADLLDLGGQDATQTLTYLGRDAAGAPVGDDALGIQRAEVGAGGDIAVLELDAEPQGLDDAAADLPLDRVVPEKGQIRA
jgi:hypothetical protein